MGEQTDASEVVAVAGVLGKALKAAELDGLIVVHGLRAQSGDGDELGASDEENLFLGQAAPERPAAKIFIGKVGAQRRGVVLFVVVNAHVRLERQLDERCRAFGITQRAGEYFALDLDMPVAPPVGIASDAALDFLEIDGGALELFSLCRREPSPHTGKSRASEPKERSGQDACALPWCHRQARRMVWHELVAARPRSGVRLFEREPSSARSYNHQFVRQR